jgi:7-cyano-7-deazaguanine reductase
VYSAARTDRTFSLGHLEIQRQHREWEHAISPAVTTRPSKQLETFPNPRLGRDYHIAFDCPEFTCLCPMTGQPDFATILIDYVPDELCVELKSLKLYLWSYRNEGAFHEAVTNQICDDLVAAISPRSITVTGKFWVRGGITTNVTVTHSK